MSHFAILCPHYAGHLYPIGNLGRKLIHRGHQITMVGPAQSAPIARQLGIPLRELDIDQVPWRASRLKWLAFHAFGASWMINLQATYCRQTEILLRLVPPILSDLSVDGLLIDQTFIGGGTLAERLGLPHATICTSVPWNEDPDVPPLFTHRLPSKTCAGLMRTRLEYAAWHGFMRPVLRVVNRHRRQWGMRPLQRMDEEYSTLAQISQMCRELDFPRRSPPTAFHYVGPLAAERPAVEDDFPWDRLDGRPLIYASLGTVPDPVNLRIFPKILAACDGLDAQLVLALGRWTDWHQGPTVRDRLGDAPRGAVLVDFAPQVALLEKAAMFITHAGQNSVMESLSRGVPLVAIPRSADQPGMAARIERSGAGLRAFFRDLSAERLRRMIRRVLEEDSFRRRAAVIQRSIAAAGGATRAAEIVEQALTTRRPVASD